MLLNCLIAKNIAGEDGGGVSARWSSEPEIINCTIADNIVTGVGYGGGVYSSYGSYTNIVDSIIWGNSASFGPQIGIGITVSPSTVEVSYSNVQGAQSDAYVEDDCSLIWDPNNLYTDPLFVIGPLGDYYLSQTDVDDPEQTVDSPCVDAGSDLASHVGMSRYTTRTDEVFDGGIVNMGYHHLFTTRAEPCKFCDMFFDHIINFKDFAVFAWNWFRDDCSDDNGWCDGADTTFDTYVNFDDLFLLTECWLVEDIVAPLPDPGEWAIEPYSSSTASISMVAKTAVDTWGWDVEYYFECAYGDCSNSDWQSDPNYTDSGLDPNTEYGYRVRACDEYGNETGWSAIGYAITSEGVDPGQEDDTAPTGLRWEPEPYAPLPNSNSIAMGAYAEDPSGVQYYFEETNYGSLSTGWQDSPTWEITWLQPNTAYAFRVKARDKSLWHNETGWLGPYDINTPAEGEPPPVVDTNAPVTPIGPYHPYTGAPDYPVYYPYKSAFAVLPQQQLLADGYHHVMTAATAADVTGPVLYKFICSESDFSSGGQGSPVLEWSPNPLYDVLVSELAGKNWVWQVQTRDSVEPPNLGYLSDYWRINGGYLYNQTPLD